MIKIITRGRTIEIPGHIDELTPKQYEYYCFIASALAERIISMDYFRIRWFSFLIGLGKADYTILRPEHIAELEGQISAIEGFIIEQEGQPARLDFETVRNLLPEYRGYKGPGDMLEGLTFGEFVECFTVAECLDPEDPVSMAEGYRQIARVLYHIPEGEEVPELLMFHAPRLFATVWRQIQTEPIEINGKKLDLRIIFKPSDTKGGRRKDDNTGWTGITFEVASAGLFGNVNEVEKADMWAVLIYLYKCKFEYLNEAGVRQTR